MPWYAYLWIATASFAGTIVALVAAIVWIGRVQEELGDTLGAGRNSQ